MIVTAWWQHVCPGPDHCAPHEIRPAPHVTEGRTMLSVMAVPISWSTGYPILNDRFRSVFAARSSKKSISQQKPHEVKEIIYFPGQVEEIGLALPPR